VALSDPLSRLRALDGVLLPERRACLRCGAIVSAYAEPWERFCWPCAPLIEDEPPFDPALYCSKGHLRAEFERMVVDRSRKSGFHKECSECKRLRDAGRDRSAPAVEAQLERRHAA
jgi:hypothetical protein